MISGTDGIRDGIREQKTYIQNFSGRDTVLGTDGIRDGIREGIRDISIYQVSHKSV